MFQPARRCKSIQLSEIRKMFDLTPENAINLSLGEPDFDTPEHIRDAVKCALDEGFTHYTSNKGIIELREAISCKLADENKIESDPEDIIVTVGASEALHISLQALVNKGDEVLIPDPGFLSYDPCVKLAEGKMVPVELHEENEFQMTAENVLDTVTDKTKAIILNSPANPTGAVMQKEDVKGIAEIAEDHNIYLISDEIYEKIIYEGKHYSPGKYTDNAITINGFSKTYAMTGFRIGYVAAKPEITEEMLKIHQYNAACATSLSQAAALEALTGPQDCVAEMLGEFKRRRDLVVKRLNEMNIPIKSPKGAFYVFPRVNNSNEFVADAIKKGVIIVGGSSFGKCGEGHFRISYAASYEQLNEAMNRLETVNINE
ncbi:pyridoxal phosphate-dependent aminotransferase [Methanobacterium sp. ACI-7]|uniref:pyridoxal phosphate-dependent aminotransferase n=1 Tax=unclassified Methanobacterium TaxID=2627676 RepID=UPI0039C4C894